MNRRQKDRLIGQTVTEIFVLGFVALVFAALDKAFYMKNLSLYAPMLCGIFTFLMIAASVFAGFLAYRKKKTNVPYYQLSAAGMVLGLMSFYVAYSKNVMFISYILWTILLIAVLSVLYTTYKIVRR